MSTHKRFTRICVSCGVEMPNSGSSKKYCTECAKERHRKNSREYMRNIRNSGEYISPANEVKRARSRSMERINDIARNTVNYGEYQAKRMEN